MAGIIISALKFAYSDILSPDMEWIYYLMTSYRLSDEYVQDYISAYYKAAKVHLGEPAQMVIDWLAGLAESQAPPVQTGS